MEEITPVLGGLMHSSSKNSSYMNKSVVEKFVKKQK